MDYSTAKCYSRDRDSYSCTQGHTPSALTNWANCYYISDFRSCAERKKTKRLPSIRVRWCTWQATYDMIDLYLSKVNINMAVRVIDTNLYTQRHVHQIKLFHIVKLNFFHSSASWLLEFYVLATSKVMSGQAQSCDIVHSWRLYSAAPFQAQATIAVT